jgi:ubiquinone biosynthesis accessory factor UbiJ
MLHTLHGLFAPAFAQRLTLALNHLLGAETVATERLRPHSGRVLMLQLNGWPSGPLMLLPAPGPFVWRVTPAGLLEWVATDVSAQPPASPDLLVQIDAANPALLLSRALAGQAPVVQVEGDAQLAGDVNWLMLNLRWDAAADLERFVGQPLAQPLHSLGSALASALGAALRGAEQVSARWRRQAP